MGVVRLHFRLVSTRTVATLPLWGRQISQQLYTLSCTPTCRCKQQVGEMDELAASLAPTAELRLEPRESWLPLPQNLKWLLLPLGKILFHQNL